MFNKVAQQLIEQVWIFAKTMPQMPHDYSLRKNWKSDQDFIDVVLYIRAKGYSRSFGKRTYRYLDVNDYCYWTMGDPIETTILINRAKLKKSSPYDAIAEKYDSFFTDENSVKENAEIMSMIGHKEGESVLDIGCGTGLFLDNCKTSNYLGIDSSLNMLALLKAKHPHSEVQHSCFESFYFNAKFDLVISLFGAASYIEERSVIDILDYVKDGGRYFIMFYQPDYKPKTYDLACIQLKHSICNHEYLPGDRIDYHNFIIISGQK